MILGKFHQYNTSSDTMFQKPIKKKYFLKNALLFNGNKKLLKALSLNQYNHLIIIEKQPKKTQTQQGTAYHASE